MHRTAALLAALTLLVTGCGSSSKSSGDGAAGNHAGAAAAQTKLITRALAEFKAARTGAYESEVTADDLSQPLAHESGSFRFTPVAAGFERAILGIDEASGKPKVQVVRVRSLAGSGSFLQLKEWGGWTGCWMRTDVATISRLTGVTISPTRPLPTAIGILANATVVQEGAGMDGPHLAVDAYSALQFLAVSGSAIGRDQDALKKVLVPVLLDVTADGGPSGAAVEGTQVVAALKAAQAPMSDALVSFASKAHARVVLSDLGEPVDVVAPPAAELLPRHPSGTTTCAANR